MSRAAGLLLLAFAGTAAVAVAAPGDDCPRIALERQRAEQARAAAVEQGDNAWKAIVPFVIIARKAGSKAAVDEADRHITALRAQAAAQGCEVRP